jgi:hypothetical protein
MDASAKTLQEYEALKRMVDEVSEDVMKAIGGNQTAGTRVRKAMQQIKNAAQSVRESVLELRKSEAV